MNAQKLPRTDALKHFSQIERRFISLARQHRADYLRLLKRIRASTSRNGRRTLMMTACAVALLATTANVQSSLSAPALFNQANAAQREGRLGPAILDYERARLLSPNESSIKQNLHVARERAGVNAPAIPLWQRPAHWLGFDGWPLLGSSALFIGCALFFGLQYVLRRAVRWISMGCGTALLMAATAIVLRWNELDRAVIQNAHTTVHIAPASNAQGTFELKAGDLVTAKREYGNFVLVRTLDQRSGWVNRSDIERVIPNEPFTDVMITKG
jgi:uncharacterized protein YgiM (DUF1202 family)